MQDKNSEGDRELNAALATYAAVEPRVGLEQRVLANLRAVQRPDAPLGWQLRSAHTALALAVLVAVVSAGWWIRSKTFNPSTSSGRTSREDLSNDAGRAVSAQSDIGKPALERGHLQERVQSTRHATDAVANHLAAQQLPQTETASEAAPKLERFPAPEPLSEQEKLLVRFVEDAPHEAALVAEARAEQLRREDEEMKEFVGGVERVQQER